MGVFDKFKKILFDEEIEEVPSGDELPERTPKRTTRSESGFMDHNGQKDEDVIKEVVYSPKPEEGREQISSRSSRYGAEEYEKKEDIPRQISRYEDTKPYMEKEERDFKPPIVEDPIPRAVEKPIEHEHRYDFGSDFDTPTVKEHTVKKEEETFVQTDKYGLRRDYKAILRNESEVRHGELEHKDYAAIVREKTETTPGKKPFVVTPVISPVYGILDKNYTPDSVIERNKDNSDLDRQKKRLYGNIEKEEVEEIKQIKEIKPIKEVKPAEEVYFDSIKAVAEEEIPTRATQAVEDAMEDTEEYNTVEPEIKYEEPVQSYVAPVEDIPIEEDPITPVVEETSEEVEYYEEPEIEEEYEAPSVSIDTLIDNPMNDEEIDVPKQKLDDTIETDLFNLIDSMYTKNNEGE